jgi:serine/threonine-protein kinase HipA
MNPDPHGAGLKLNISETDNAHDIDLALSVASVFRVKKKRAQEIVSEVTDEESGTKIPIWFKEIFLFERGKRGS